MADGGVNLAEQSHETAEQPRTLDVAAIVSKLDRLLEASEFAMVELLSPAQAAKFLNVSLSQFKILDNKGLIPAPLILSDRCPRWSKTELRLWIADGTPIRKHWQPKREAKLRAAG